MDFSSVNILFVIVTYNAMKWIDRCLDSVDSVIVKHDIYIVDNGSSDGTQDYIARHYPNVIFYQSDQNLGFGKANNIGLRYALNGNYEYVYLLNQDAWLCPGCIEEMLKVMQCHSEYGVLSPFQMQANMHVLDNDFNFVCFTGGHLISDMYLSHLDDVYDVPDVPAAHWLISRECLKKVGGFSPSFPHYGEDNNYAQRVRFFGFMVGVVPGAMAVHDREMRKKTLKNEMYMSCYINLIILLSNPKGLSKIMPLLQWSLSCFVYLVRFRQLAPLKYSCKLIKEYHVIKHNLWISTHKDCAFLK